MCNEDCSQCRTRDGRVVKMSGKAYVQKNIKFIPHREMRALDDALSVVIEEYSARYRDELADDIINSTTFFQTLVRDYLKELRELYNG